MLQFIGSARFMASAHYQIMSIIYLKEFMKLNVNSDTMIKNVKHVGLHINIATFFLKTQILKIF